MNARICWTLLLIATGAQAGVVVSYVESGKPETFYVEGNKFRHESSRQIVIYDGDAKQLIQIEPSEKTYSVTTDADMREMGKEMQEMMKKYEGQMQEQLKNLPPEQRKAMEERMGKAGMGGGEPTAPHEPMARYDRTGEKRKIAGHECEMFKVAKGNEIEQQCILPWSAGVVKKSDFDVFKSMSQFYGQMSSGMGHQVARDAQAGLGHMLDAPGVPLMKSSNHEGDNQEVKRLERTSVSADKFRAPSGFTQQPSPMREQMRRHKR